MINNKRPADEPPRCLIKEWRRPNRRWSYCTTGGEKWKCEGYVTETPGQLNNADKAKRDQWKSIEELRESGELTGAPVIGYYYEDGIRIYGERHPNYGRWSNTFRKFYYYTLPW